MAAAIRPGDVVMVEHTEHTRVRNAIYVLKTTDGGGYAYGFAETRGGG